MGAGGAGCRREKAAARRRPATRWVDGGYQKVTDRTPLRRWLPPPLGVRLAVPSGGAVVPLVVEALPAIGRASYREVVSQRRRVADRGLAAAEARLGSSYRFTSELIADRWSRAPLRTIEDEVGGFAVEVTAKSGGQSEVTLAGAIDRPAVAAGTVAAVAAIRAAGEGLGSPGAHGVAWHGPAVAPMMAELWRRGVRAARFDGDNGVHPLVPLENG